MASYWGDATKIRPSQHEPLDLRLSTSSILRKQHDDRVVVTGTGSAEHVIGWTIPVRHLDLAISGFVYIPVLAIVGVSIKIGQRSLFQHEGLLAACRNYRSLEPSVFMPDEV